MEKEEKRKEEQRERKSEKERRLGKRKSEKERKTGGESRWERVGEKGRREERV